MALNQVDKNWLTAQLETQSQLTVKAIDNTATKMRNDILDRIDRLEKFYALDDRVKRIEKKLGIKLPV